MQLKTRLTILAAFVIVFLVTAPLLLLYTAGYRWNFKKHRVEKVGIIFIRSTPSNADVYLNGVQQQERTPARLRDLLADTYDLRVQKEGYGAWEKHLSVESALTTFAEGIVLWKNADTIPSDITLADFAKLKNAAAETAAKSNDRFETDGFEISVTRKDGGRETITRLGDPILMVAPYPTGSYVFYVSKDQIHAIELDGRDQRNDDVLVTAPNITDMVLDAKGETLYFITKKDGVTAAFSRQLQ